MTKEDERTTIAAGQKAIIMLLSELVEHSRTKTAVENFEYLKKVASKEDLDAAVDQRVKLSSLEQCIETQAAFEGKTVEQFLDPNAHAMREVRAKAEAERKEREQAMRAKLAKQQELLQQAEQL